MVLGSLKLSSEVALVIGLALTGGVTEPSISAAVAGQAPPPSVDPVKVSATLTVGPDEAQDIPRTAETDDRTGFGTRYAYFQPADWNQLPGWHDDHLPEAWAAFQRTCAAMAKNYAWTAVCARARVVEAESSDGVRQFFEREFSPYEIRNPDRTPEGLITGYYEPLMVGSRKRGGRFVYPIYGTPDDLLLLDVRRVPRELRGTPIAAQIQGRTVIPVLSGRAPYVIHAGNVQADVRDKKIRLRLEGKRIVPYPTRADIERDGLPRARVLAWVDNPAAFYSMQIQGSGKVRLPGGNVVRLAYAEQNGHPFRPPVSEAGSGTSRSRVTTRGLNIVLPDEGEEPVNDGAVAAEGGQPVTEPSTRGAKSDADQKAARGAFRTPPRPSDEDAFAPEVQRLIKDLAAGKVIGGGPSGEKGSSSVPAATSLGGGKGRHNRSTEDASSGDSPAGRGSDLPDSSVEVVVPVTFPHPSAAMRAAISADPSYVFFREIADGPEGPIGALGVPLTAGRSVAVDPRTTPLGFPVFVSASQPGNQEQLNRLMMAQDTGGAIRGAVRADYFWGFGADAYANAARMKANGRMWVLFPRELGISVRDEVLRTRGAGESSSDVDCVVPDSEHCVEDP